MPSGEYGFRPSEETLQTYEVGASLPPHVPADQLPTQAPGVALEKEISRELYERRRTLELRMQLLGSRVSKAGELVNEIMTSSPGWSAERPNPLTGKSFSDVANNLWNFVKNFYGITKELLHDMDDPAELAQTSVEQLLSQAEENYQKVATKIERLEQYLVVVTNDQSIRENEMDTVGGAYAKERLAMAERFAKKSKEDDMPSVAEQYAKYVYEQWLTKKNSSLSTN